MRRPDQPGKPRSRGAVAHGRLAGEGERQRKGESGATAPGCADQPAATQPLKILAKEPEPVFQHLVPVAEAVILVLHYSYLARLSQLGELLLERAGILYRHARIFSAMDDIYRAGDTGCIGEGALVGTGEYLAIDQEPP